MSRLTRGGGPYIFYDLPGCLQDLDFHLFLAHQPLELPDAGVGLAQLAGGDHVLIGPDVELADALDRRPLELRAKDPPPVRLPRMIAPGASRRILRPYGAQSKRGALHRIGQLSAYGVDLL